MCVVVVAVAAVIDIIVAVATAAETILTARQDFDQDWVERLWIIFGDLNGGSTEEEVCGDTMYMSIPS